MLSKRGRKIVLILTLVIALLAISVLGGGLGEALGFGFLVSPIPVISFAAETAFYVFGFPISNSTVLFWIVGLILIFLTFLATRNLREVPRGLQNFFELILEFLTNLAKGLSKNATKFLGVAFILFVVILFSNWAGIFPLVGSLGRLENVEEWVGHREHAILADLEQDESLSHLSPDALHELAIIQTLLQNSDQEFVIFEGGGSFLFIPFGRGQRSQVPITSVADFDPAELMVWDATLRETGHLTEAQLDEYHHVEEALKASVVVESFENVDGKVIDEVGKTAGILVPYLRGPSTDLNTTLSFTIFAVLAVHFFGVAALGFRGYGGKFINLRRGPMALFVGTLEIISELSRVVSFSFRLFGNLFAGEVLIFAMAFLLPLIGILPFLGLEVFVGAVQAFIFAMLVLVFSHLATQSHDEH